MAFQASRDYDVLDIGRAASAMLRGQVMHA